MQGKDVNTCFPMNYNDFVRNSRVLSLDLREKGVFEVDPNIAQTIKLRGRSVGGTSRLICLLFNNRKTILDFSNSESTKPSKTV